MEISQLVRANLHKPYMDFIEEIRFDLNTFREDLNDVKHLLNKELVIYLQGATEKSKIKEAFKKFLSTDYSENLDELFSKHFKSMV